MMSAGAQQGRLCKEAFEQTSAGKEAIWQRLTEAGINW